tara:strand:+ start:213 stop:434 length:222 start_codon:yes stop_codon:yes gene_type:complete
MVKITKDMILSEVLETYPEVAPILVGYGLHCVGCQFSNIDTIESGAKIHGMDKETFEMMLKDINTIANNKILN